MLCTATNCTPHERFYSFSRRSLSGVSTPSWLTAPGKVLLKRSVTASKYEPKIDVVNLEDANPQYAHVRLPDGQQTTVATNYLAPTGDIQHDLDIPLQNEHGAEHRKGNADISKAASETVLGTNEEESKQSSQGKCSPVVLRRSQRTVRPPDRLTYES